MFFIGRADRIVDHGKSPNRLRSYCTNIRNSKRQRRGIIFGETVYCLQEALWLFLRLRKTKIELMVKSTLPTELKIGNAGT